MQSYSEVVLRNRVSWFQSSVFLFIKIWYDDSTARLDRFSQNAFEPNIGFAEIMQLVNLDLLCLMLRYIFFGRFQKDKHTHP